MATTQAQHKPPARAPVVVSLASIKRGKAESPMRITIYGVEGIGKSSFAAGAPSPLFLDTEDGTSKLDVARVAVNSWDELMAWLDQLTTAEHEFKTVVIDTLDALEQKLWKHICEQKRIESIEDLGFGKGYVAALEHWREMLSKVERMRDARGIHVIFCAHATVKPFKNPEGEDFDRYQMKLNDKAAGLLKGWCETVLFAQYETFAVEDAKTKRAKGVSSGNRLIRTQRTAAWDAKNRDSLPESLPLDWSEFSAAVEANAPQSPDRLRARIAKLLESADDTLRANVEAAVQKSPDDAAHLARVADKLAAKLNLQIQENAQ